MVAWSECRRHDFDIRPGNAKLPGSLAPVTSGAHHFRHDCRALVFRQLVPFCRIDDGGQARTVVRFVQIEDVVCLVDVGIEVECRRQTPPRRRQ